MEQRYSIAVKSRAEPGQELARCPEVRSTKIPESLLNHLVCGDCTSVMRQIPSRSVDIVITDVPYLVNYRPRDGRRCLNDDDARWLQPAFQELQRVLKADSFCVCFYGWPWIDRFMQVWKACGFRPVSHLAWVKGYPSREGYMKSFHEVGFLLAKGKPAKPLEPLSDVLPWDYSGNKLHPNQKPVMAIKPLIETYSQPGDVVLDPFAGSGTTGVGARACGRQFILIEKDPSVFRLAQQRLDTFEPA